MRTSSWTPSATSLPSVAAGQTDGDSAPPPSDSSASFNDVLQQHEGDPSKSNSAATTGSASATTPAATKSGVASGETDASTTTPVSSTPIATAPAAPVTVPAGAGVKNTLTSLASGSGLSAMIVQATVLASNARASSSNPGPTQPTTPNPGGAAKNTAADTTFGSPNGSSDIDLSALIAQAAALLGLNVAKAPAPTANSTPAAKTPKDSATESGSDPSSGQNLLASSATNASDLSALIAQAANLATSASQASAATSNSTAAVAPGALATALTTLGNKIPLPGSGQASPQTSPREKKSSSTSTEGIFLQSGRATAKAAPGQSGMQDSTLSPLGQYAIGQTLTQAAGAKNSPAHDALATSPALAGTANVEKQGAMNATLNLLGIFSGIGTGPAAPHAPADLHIQLSNNNEFADALKQVMHVAQLTQTNETPTPMRVAIEIQTPPGAIVNVYVSRQNDQWRAQLSTNDPQAMRWVQDKMTSLRQSGDFGVEVKWLPPQMESSSGGDANLSWDRGGQGQSGYQQPDDRPQPQRQNRSDAEPELVAAGADPFATALTALGGVA